MKKTLATVLLTLSLATPLQAESLSVSFGNCSCTIAHQQSQEKRRTVNLAVFNDQTAPVTYHTIYELVKQVNEEYKYHTNINFKIEQYRTTIVQGLPSNIAEKCNETVDLAVYVTNKRGYNIREHETVPIGGLARPNEGFIMLFRVSQGSRKPINIDGTTAATQTAMHELGHMFDVEHEKSTYSFMHAEESLKGDWTAETIDQISQNREKVWLRND